MASSRSRRQLRWRLRAVAVWARPRAALVAGGLGVGFVCGVVATIALAAYGDSTAFGTRKAFALGALVFGFATLGWAGSILAGRSIETLQRRLDTASDWTEADSRRAMARILGFGAGMVFSVATMDVLL